MVAGRVIRRIPAEEENINKENRNAGKEGHDTILGEQSSLTTQNQPDDPGDKRAGVEKQNDLFKD